MTVTASNPRALSQRVLTLQYVARQDSTTSAMTLHHAYGNRAASLVPPHSGEREMARRRRRMGLG